MSYTCFTDFVHHRKLQSFWGTYFPLFTQSVLGQRSLKMDYVSGDLPKLSLLQKWQHNSFPAHLSSTWQWLPDHGIQLPCPASWPMSALTPGPLVSCSDLPTRVGQISFLWSCRTAGDCPLIPQAGSRNLLGLHLILPLTADFPVEGV